MGGAEIDGVWLAKLNGDGNQRAAEERVREQREIMKARKEAALASAKALLSRAGSTSFDRANIIHEEVSLPIPMGDLGVADEEGRRFGFARVFVYTDIKRREVVSKGRFFKKVEIVREPSDEVSRFGVLYDVANEDGSNRVSFDVVDWSITNRGYETDEPMSVLEARLMEVTAALDATSTDMTV